MRFKKIGTFGIGTLLFFGSLHLQAATQYKIEDLGKIPDGASKIVSINENGDHTISLQNNMGETNTYLVSSGVAQDIGSLGYGGVTVTALNTNQQSTGSALTDTLTNKHSAFLYSSGNMMNIETSAAIYSQGQDINGSGVSVGNARLFDKVSLQYSYDPQAGQMVYLNDIAPVNQLPDGSACIYSDCWNLMKASGINTNGIITGTGTASYAVDSFPTFALMLNKLRAYIYDGQKIISLGTLGGDFSTAAAINDQGHVAGISDLYHEVFTSPFDPNPAPIVPDPSRVFLYDGNKMNDLGILDEGEHSIVEAMNNNDVVVGAVLINSVEHAFMSSRSGLLDLNDILSSTSEWTKLNSATDINDNGVIVGYGQINGETHGFKLVPIEKSELACLHVSAEICTKILSKTQ